MAPLNSSRVAWSIAIASLALWATSAPLTWSQVAVRSAGHLFDQAVDDTTTSSTTTVSQTLTNETPTTTTDDAGAPSAPCPPLAPALTQPAAPAPVAPVEGSQQGTFHLCGADAGVARSIEQLIGGRGFSAALTSHGDGCADLTISASSSGSGGGSATSHLKVSLGSGRSLSIQIVSAGGSTHVDIGQGQ
jgi:hypothetical protein